MLVTMAYHLKENEWLVTPNLSGASAMQAVSYYNQLQREMKEKKQSKT